MVKLYNGLENRDLWEYQLDLSAERVDFILLHAWELVNSHFEFYFMRENCSYHLLSLLEVADPELNIKDERVAWTLPAETLKQVVETPGMVQEIVYRPSLCSQLEQQLQGLTTQEREYEKRLAHDPGSIEPEKRASIPDVHLASVIDTAIVYSQYVGIANKEKKKSKKEKDTIYWFSAASWMSVALKSHCRKPMSWFLPIKVMTRFDSQFRQKIPALTIIRSRQRTSHLLNYLSSQDFMIYFRGREAMRQIHR